MMINRMMNTKIPMIPAGTRSPPPALAPSFASPHYIGTVIRKASPNVEIRPDGEELEESNAAEHAYSGQRKGRDP
jgi:hypothetical protein